MPPRLFPGPGDFAVRSYSLRVFSAKMPELVILQAKGLREIVLTRELDDKFF